MTKQFPHFSSWTALQHEVVSCYRCPRLVAFREQVEARKSFENDNYWRKPVSGFGDPNAWLLITGLAPAAHGGNRTGRLFTGDLSSKFLFNALHEVGLSNHPYSEHRGDGLELYGCYMTAVVKCVPPKDKPIRQEVLNCNCYYQNELFLLKNVSHILALGKLAFDTYRLTLRLQGQKIPNGKFAHGQHYDFKNGPTVYASYHPSPQNTNTGKLTQKMFVDLLNAIKKDRQRFLETQ